MEFNNKSIFFNSFTLRNFFEKEKYLQACKTLKIILKFDTSKETLWLTIISDLSNVKYCQTDKYCHLINNFKIYNYQPRICCMLNASAGKFHKILKSLHSQKMKR